MNKENFLFLYQIGKGSCSIVSKVQCKITKNFYAIKQISKVQIIDKGAKDSIIQEKLLLSKMYNSFIVNLYCSFQDYDYLYLVLDLIPGGDLRFHLSHYPFAYTEIQIKFLVANLLIAIGYIHSLNIMHRDLKPENILLDNRGYAYITDFGIARYKGNAILNDTSGTPEYMAPEILFELDQGLSADFYSLGVIIFELMLGYKPYSGVDFDDVKKSMLTTKITLENSETYSIDLLNLCNRLLKRNPDKRLGTSSGISELKSCNFFNGFDWENVEKKIIQSPFYDIIQYSKNRNVNSKFDELFDKDIVNNHKPFSEAEQIRFNEYQLSDEYIHLFRKFTVVRLNLILNKNNSTNKPKFCAKCERKFFNQGRVDCMPKEENEGDFLNLKGCYQQNKFDYTLQGNKLNDKVKYNNEKEKINQHFIFTNKYYKNKIDEYERLINNNTKLNNYLINLKDHYKKVKKNKILDDDISGDKSYYSIVGSNISKSDLSDNSKLYKNFNKDYIKYKLNKYVNLFNKYNEKNIGGEFFRNLSQSNIFLPPIFNNYFTKSQNTSTNSYILTNKDKTKEIFKIKKYLNDNNIKRRLKKEEIRKIFKNFK